MDIDLENNEGVKKFAEDIQKIVSQPQAIFVEPHPQPMNVASYSPVKIEKHLPSPIKITNPKVYMA